MPVSDIALTPQETLRKSSLFKFHQKPELSGDTHHLFMLGTDTSYVEQDGYPEGETFSKLYHKLPQATIIDGPKQPGVFCPNANEVPSHTVGLMLELLTKGPLKILDIGAHSRGSMGALIVAHELDRIKNLLDGLTDEASATEIKKHVQSSQDATTQAILEAETEHFSDTQWTDLKKNIKDLRLKLFLLDPVPGNYNSLYYYRWVDKRIKGDGHFIVAPIVEKIHVQYAQHERSHQFDAAIVKHPQGDKSTHITRDSLPGHHGTASGSITDRGVVDNSSFITFYRKLDELLQKSITTCKDTSSDDEDLIGSVAVVVSGNQLKKVEQSPSTLFPLKTRLEVCITESYEGWNEIQGEAAEVLKNEVKELVKRLFREDYARHLLGRMEDKSLSAKDFVAKLYKTVLQDFNLVQKISLLKIIEFFDLKPENFVEDTEVVEGAEAVEGIKARKFSSLTALIDEISQCSTDIGAVGGASAAGSAQISWDDMKLNCYKILALLKDPHFSSFAKTCYDGLGALTSDKPTLGRQVRCGDKAGILQDEVWIPSDQSPFVNEEHRRLSFEHVLKSIHHAHIEGINPNIQKVGRLIHAIIQIHNHPLKCGAASSKNNDYDKPATHLLSSYLTEIIIEGKEERIKELFIITKKFTQLPTIRSTLFTSEDPPKFPSFTEGSTESLLLEQLFKDERGNGVILAEAAKSDVGRILNEAINDSLNNIERQIAQDIDDINSQWNNLKEFEDKLKVGARKELVDALEIKINTAEKHMDFLKNSQLRLPASFFDKFDDRKKILEQILQQVNFEREIVLREEERLDILSQEEDAFKKLLVECSADSAKLAAEAQTARDKAEASAVKLQSQVDVLQREIDEMKKREKEECQPTLDGLLELLRTYESQLESEKNNNSKKLNDAQFEKKEAFVARLKGILLSTDLAPREKITAYNKSLEEESKVFNESKDSSLKEFICASLRIIALLISGIAAYRALSGKSLHFFKPNNEANFIAESKEKMAGLINNNAASSVS